MITEHSESDPSSGSLDPIVLKKFRRAVAETYDTLQRMGYGDHEGLDEFGAIGMVRRHLKSSTVSQGFLKLWEMGRLNISLEALVLRREFASMFTDEEREIARQRLHQRGFDELD